jgi:hypothetical protein
MQEQHLSPMLRPDPRPHRDWLAGIDRILIHDESTFQPQLLGMTSQTIGQMTARMQKC